MCVCVCGGRDGGGGGACGVCVCVCEYVRVHENIIELCVCVQMERPTHKDEVRAPAETVHVPVLVDSVWRPASLARSTQTD